MITLKEIYIFLSHFQGVLSEQLGGGVQTCLGKG